MKKRICSFFAVLIIIINLFSFTTFALSDKENNFDIIIDKNYTVLTAENLKNNEDVLKKLNFTWQGFKNYLSANNITLYAIDTKNGSEIVLKVISTDFAENISDLSLLDDISADSIANKIVGESQFSLENFNNTKFIKTKFESTDKGGNFYGTQYFTIKNGQVYSLSISFPTSVDMQSASNIEKNLVKNFVIRTTSSFSWKNLGDTVTIVIISLVILLFVVIAGYVVYSLVSEFKIKNSSNDVAPYVKIRRRKF